MNIPRLQNAYAFLRDQIPEARFYLSAWHSKAECGTIACAGGWLSYSPEAQAAGYTLSERGENFVDNRPILQPSYEGAVSFGALANYFELTLSEAEMLFGVRSTTTLYTVQEQIDEEQRTGAKIPDKTIWMRRMERFAKHHGFDLPPQRFAEPVPAVFAAITRTEPEHQEQD